jgi:hypothetical protein
MTHQDALPDRLAQLGDALERAVRADLATRAPARTRFRHPRRVAAGVALTAILVPAAAIAATELISPSQVAASLPQGTKALIGTKPTCTVVTTGVEYHCVLTSPPSTDGAPTTAAGAPAWKGTVEPTVDAAKRVNGGCRSLTDAGTDWECYIGEAAVHENIVAQGLLGQYAPSPGVG